MWSPSQYKSGNTGSCKFIVLIAFWQHFPMTLVTAIHLYGNDMNFIVFLLIIRDRYMAWEWQCTIHPHEQESLYTSNNRNSNAIRAEILRTNLTWVTCHVTAAEFSASSLHSWRQQPTAHFSRPIECIFEWRRNHWPRPLLAGFANRCSLSSFSHGSNTFYQFGFSAWGEAGLVVCAQMPHRQQRGQQR